MTPSSHGGNRRPRVQGTQADAAPARGVHATVALFFSVASVAANVLLAVVVTFWFGWLGGPGSSWHKEPDADTYLQLAAMMMALPALAGIVGFILTRRIDSADDSRVIARLALGFAIAGAVLVPVMALGIIAFQHGECR